MPINTKEPVNNQERPLPELLPNVEAALPHRVLLGRPS